jgi:hypothetical protein
VKSVADACNLPQRNSLINWIHIAVLDKEIEIEFGNQRTLVEAQNQLFSLCVTDHLMSTRGACSAELFKTKDCTNLGSLDI